MDYAESLRVERTKSHAIFHSVIMELPKYDDATMLLFFEGEDDPSFYCPHIRAINNAKQYLILICYGRLEVIKTLELIDQDGRAILKSLFFIDKDHNEFVGVQKSHPRLFQTKYYSIENYLVCKDSINAYWAEYLHLSSLDSRKEGLVKRFENTYKSFEKRMLTLMALTLIGRGFTSRPARKLNLNNANLDLIFHIDFDKEQCKYLNSAGKHFAISTNVVNYNETPKIFNKNAIETILKNTFPGIEPKEIIRGKYELWFLVKYLQFIAKKLSSKVEAKATGLQRATPKSNITQETAIEQLGARIRIPEDLRVFLSRLLNDATLSHTDEFQLDSK